MHARTRMIASLTAAAAATLALVLIPAGSASSMKLAGTPATYADPTGDAKTAPDLANVAMDLDSASGALKIEIDLAGSEDLANGGLVAVFFDTDHNTATGDQTGSDYALLIGGSGYAFLKWNGKDMDLFAHQPTVLAKAPGKLVVLLCTCDLGTQTFDFAVVSVRGNDVDVAPDNGASFPVQENAVSIASLLYTPTPLLPKAGKRFTIRIGGVRVEGSDEVVLPDTATCSAKLGGKALKGSPAGACSWLLPKKARGKKLTVSVNVSYHGDSETFSQTFKVT